MILLQAAKVLNAWIASSNIWLYCRAFKGLMQSGNSVLY